MTSAFGSEQLVVATRRHVSCTVAGEAVILHLEDGVYYGLNPVGTRVWQLLQEPRTVGQLVAQIVEEFEVTEERCEGDVQELLASLSERGLVDVTSTAEG